MGSAPSKQTDATPQTWSEKTGRDSSVNDVQQSFSELTLQAKPVSADGSLTKGQVSDWETQLVKDPKLRLTRTILTHTSIQAALASIRATSVTDPHVFNTALDFKTNPVTAQNSSGRCWLFATTNVLRYSVMKKLGLKEFQLSQSYLFIYDKLEKANYYLELSIQYANLPLDDRKVSNAALRPVNDGGQWDMACNLIDKYGVVPIDVFPETYSSSNSSQLNSLVTTKLREDALILRRLHGLLRKDGSLSAENVTNALRSKKEELMREIWTLLSTTLGAPPPPDEEFTWDYLDGNGKAQTWSGTPKAFCKAFTSHTYHPTDSFSLINDPRNDYDKLYTVEALGNVWGARPVLYVNTTSERLKAAVVKLLKSGQPVFFGSDVGKSSSSTAGIMDTDLYEYDNAFNIKLGMTKAERLQTNESAMTHAMVISGVHVDPKSGKPVRYKVENSWGPDVGNKGYFVMSDKWFDEFVYQVVVPKGLADKDLLEVFEKGEKVVLPPWDPMGSLA